VFKNVVEKYIPKNARMVVYQPGHRGMACIRILSSHKEAFYNKFMCYRSVEDPLGFSNSLDNDFDNNNYESYDKVDLRLFFASDASVIGKIVIVGQYKYILKAAKMAKEKLFFISTHMQYSYDIPYVYVFISNPEWIKERIDQEVKYNTCWVDHFTDFSNFHKIHLSNPDCFCIDAYKLLSLDNQLFEEEYARIIDHFNFTSNRERVRQFVLTYRNREKQLREWQRTNSFPVPSQLK